MTYLTEVGAFYVLPWHISNDWDRRGKRQRKLWFGMKGAILERPSCSQARVGGRLAILWKAWLHEGFRHTRSGTLCLTVVSKHSSLARNCHSLVLLSILAYMESGLLLCASSLEHVPQLTEANIVSSHIRDNGSNSYISDWMWHPVRKSLQVLKLTYTEVGLNTVWWPKAKNTRLSGVMLCHFRDLDSQQTVTGCSTKALVVRGEQQLVTLCIELCLCPFLTNLCLNSFRSKKQTKTKQKQSKNARAQ